MDKIKKPRGQEMLCIYSDAEGCKSKTDVGRS